MPTTLDAKLTIRKHWKPSAVFTGSLCPGQGQKVAEGELVEAEQAHSVSIRFANPDIPRSKKSLPARRIWSLSGRRTPG